MSNIIPPSRQALTEALNLSGEILQNVELTELSLANIALKTSRLARLLNDFDVQKIMEYEAGGYPSPPTGVSPGVWRLGVIAGREFEIVDPKTKTANRYMYTESIGELEEQLRIAEAPYPLFGILMWPFLPQTRVNLCGHQWGMFGNITPYANRL